jgi:4-hydroxy-3-methylbut-2-enyl diphosphate reductase
MQIVVANPRGFCAGVERAILIVERALEEFGAPVYVRHEIVHNRHVVDTLRTQGAIFVDDLSAIPPGARAIISAHGAAQAVADEARQRGLRLLDATCPLVTKVHVEVARHGRAGRSVILVGHEGHAEVDGTLGHFQAQGSAVIRRIDSVAQAQTVAVPNPQQVAYATQTTLSVDDTARILAVLKQRFPAIRGPQQDDICYATQNRQTAARALAERAQLVLVVGSPHSSNSQRLLEVVTQTGRPGHLVENADALQRDWFDGLTVVGLTSGASVPEMLVDRVIQRLRSWWPDAEVQAFGEPERVVFNLPRPLQRGGRPAAGRASTLVPRAAAPDLQDVPGVPGVPVALPASVRARTAARSGLAGGRK